MLEKSRKDAQQNSLANLAALPTRNVYCFINVLSLGANLLSREPVLECLHLYLAQLTQSQLVVSRVLFRSFSRIGGGGGGSGGGGGGGGGEGKLRNTIKCHVVP